MQASCITLRLCKRLITLAFMHAAIAVRSCRSVTVLCGGCGARFELSVRNEYEHRRRGRTPRCEVCRRPRAELGVEERERFRRWWLEESGLSLDELLEIAVGLG